MPSFTRTGRLRLAAAFALLSSAALPAVARAQGDLLVAPTRVVMSGGGTAEVILDNIGTQTATYRISLELRRMDAEGDLVDVPLTAATDAEKAALAMVRYSPRRITLEPNQPQEVRISARPTAELPNGEYRVHMLFRAIPDPTEAAKAIEQPTATGLSIRLTPIYGISIPLIVRKGQLDASATLANARLEQSKGMAILKIDLQRSGDRSVYGDITASRGGKVVYAARGLAVYPELTTRTVVLQLSPDEAAKLHGPLHFEYREPAEAGAKLIASLNATLP